MSLSFSNKTITQMIAYLQKLKKSLKQDKNLSKKQGKSKGPVHKAAHKGR